MGGGGGGGGGGVVGGGGGGGGGGGLIIDIWAGVTQKKSLQILDFHSLASLDYVLQQVQTLSLL